MPHPRRGCTRQNDNKQSRLVIHPPTPQDSCLEDKKEEREKITTRKSRRIKAQKSKNKERPRSNQLLQLAARVEHRHVPLTSVVGLVCPTYLCSRPGALLPLSAISFYTFRRPPRFTFYSSCCVPSPHTLGRVSSHSSCCSLPHSLWHHPRIYDIHWIVRASFLLLYQVDAFFVFFSSQSVTTQSLSL